MAQKFATITLRIQVQDLDADELKEAAEQGGCDLDELPGIDEVEPDELADGIVQALSQREEVEQEYIWAGSNLFAKFGTIQVLNAQWSS